MITCECGAQQIKKNQWNCECMAHSIARHRMIMMIMMIMMMIMVSSVALFPLDFVFEMKISDFTVTLERPKTLNSCLCLLTLALIIMIPSMMMTYYLVSLWWRNQQHDFDTLSSEIFRSIAHSLSIWAVIHEIASFTTAAHTISLCFRSQLR